MVFITDIMVWGKKEERFGYGYEEERFSRILVRRGMGGSAEHLESAMAWKIVGFSGRVFALEGGFRVFCTSVLSVRSNKISVVFVLVNVWNLLLPSTKPVVFQFLL